MTSEQLAGSKDNMQRVDVEMAESNRCRRVGTKVTPKG